MALLVSDATGDFTSAATWSVAEAGTDAQLTNPSASTNTTTSYVYSSTFTGTNANVVDGVALFVKRNNTTGTFTVSLSEDNGTTATRTVTVNASDLPLDESWVFFKFATTLTLDGGTDYKVGVLSSSAGSVAVYRNATAGNWGRILRTTTTAAPAAGDAMLIVGEFTGAGSYNAFTVTMNNTATTDFGTGTTGGNPNSQSNAGTFSGIVIGAYGTLTWGTSAATNYYLKLSGNLNIWSGGTMNMGTSGTPCPRDSTMWLQFDCGAADNFGMNIMNGATINTYGQSRTSGKDIWFCKLTSDAAANATSLSVDTDTGWLDNDEIAVGSTTRTNTQCEKGTLNGAAGASSLTVDGFAGTAGGLAFAHGGTSPVVAEIILLTRNVKISGATATFVCYINYGFNQSTRTTANFYWTEIYWTSSFTIYGSSTTTSTFTMSYCCIHDATGVGVFTSGVSSTNTVTVTYTSVYNAAGSAGISLQRSSAGVTITLSDIIIMFSGTTQSINGGAAVSYTNIIIVGGRSGGIAFGGATGPINSDHPIPTNITVHSCVGVGITIQNGNGISFSLTNLNVWRNSGVGITVGATTTALITITNSTFFGNTTSNLNNSVATILTLDNCVFAADSSFATTNGMSFVTFVMGKISNCTFGVVSGIFRAHTNDINYTTANRPILMLELFNTILDSTTEVASTTSLGDISYIKSSKHDQTTGSFKTWFKNGIIQRDSTIFNTAAPSERMTPVSSTEKLSSGSRIVAVDSSRTVTINVYVRKSTAGDGAEYNGNQPRLMVRKNIATGITTDTVLDTMTVSTGTWEQLSGTTVAASDDGAFEFFVDCDGTAGWINVDDWSVS